MEEESFIGAFGDVPTDLAGDYCQLYIFRAEDFGAWCRRVRDAHEREVDALRGETYLDAVSDSVLAKHGLVRMPTDADGVPIHVGDVMEWLYGNGEFIVEGIGGNTLFYIDKDSGECEWTAAGDKRHHHAPTVEKERPDSLDRIADELEKWCDHVDVDGDACGKPRALVERIRRLAAKEGDYGPF